MIHYLIECGYVYLHQIYLHNAFLLYYQTWTLAANLDLSVGETLIWDHYILSLKNNLVCLSNMSDTLLWTKNTKDGSYSPRWVTWCS